LCISLLPGRFLAIAFKLSRAFRRRYSYSSYMNQNSQTPIGDLSGKETELNVPTPEMVTKRAREIALIHERNPDEFTQEDWEQARFELTGVKTGASWEDPVETAASLSERGSVPGETGAQAPRIEPKDEALLDERLVTRGVDEAAHDQMVEAAKEDQTQEG
jgi:hypothetical protein